MRWRAVREADVRTTSRETIDHSLLRPELDDAFIDGNLVLARASTRWRP